MHVQIDIVARDPEGLLHLLEVKSEGSWEFGVLSNAQKRRLQRAAASMAQRFAVALSVVVVSDQKCLLLPIEDL